MLFDVLFNWLEYWNSALTAPAQNTGRMKKKSSKTEMSLSLAFSRNTLTWAPDSLNKPAKLHKTMQHCNGTSTLNCNFPWVLMHCWWSPNARFRSIITLHHQHKRHARIPLKHTFFFTGCTLHIYAQCIWRWDSATSAFTTSIYAIFAFRIK